MNAVDAKPSANGTIKLGRRGWAKIQLDDDSPVFNVDVIAVYDLWYEIDWALRDKEGVLPNDKQNEHGQNRLNFVQQIFAEAYAKIGHDSEVPQLSRADAENFIAKIREEAAKLRDFFSPKKDTPSSSPESTQTEIRFSQ